MGSTKLLRVIEDFAPIRYRSAHVAMARPREIVDLHERGLAVRAGCRRLVVAGGRATRSGLVIEVAQSVRDVASKLGPNSLLITDEPSLASAQKTAMAIGAVGSLDKVLPTTFTILRSGSFEVGLNYEPALSSEKIDRHRLKIVRTGGIRWRTPKEGARLRRWENHTPVLTSIKRLDPSHPAAKQGRTLYPSRVIDPEDAPRIFVSGHNSRKLGGVVQKGRWKGFPIVSITLEERRSCPRTCSLWHECYGNSMQWSKRLRHGPKLEAMIEDELENLAERHPAGFVVRAHVLGDFYSARYVKKWKRWLRMFPAAHVFGYTAWAPDSPIGCEIGELAANQWDRFAVRFSNASVTEQGATTVFERPAKMHTELGIICPVQVDRTECCASCGLCWNSKTNIVFLAH
ncbi:MAG TPA: hypothetical protein VFB13_17530 [Reyranella sp.]|nr:hypothetical protein [Chloroflexota bacterium]HZQ01351.1 hypothetical protein [Reyranella sp.]